MRSHFISIIMTAITKQTEISKYWRGCGELASTGEDVEKLESVSNVTENENGCSLAHMALRLLQWKRDTEIN